MADLLAIPSRNTEEILTNFHSSYPVKLSGEDLRITVVTRGPKSVFVAVGQEIKEYGIDTIEDDLVKDTTGAGDAFLAGFMSDFMGNKTIDECVRRGNEVAQKIIQCISCDYETFLLLSEV